MTFVVVVSVSPCFSTFDTTSTIAFSPSVASDLSEVAEVATSRLVCSVALASRAVAISASFSFLDARGFLVDFAGLAFLAGEVPLGLPLAFGVDARAVVPFGGGRNGLSPAVNLNLGGGEIAFELGSSVL